MNFEPHENSLWKAMFGNDYVYPDELKQELSATELLKKYKKDRVGCTICDEIINGSAHTCCGIEHVD